MTYSRRKIQDFLIKKANSNDRDYSYFHPSSFGNCEREIIFDKYKIPVKTEFSLETFTKFDFGHSIHDRIQNYFIKADVVCIDKVKKIDLNSYSKVALEDDGKIGKPRVLIYGESGRTYPYFHSSFVIKTDFDDHNKFTPITDLKVGDEWYLIEVPFEIEELHMAGHIDGIINDNGDDTILEIKSINDRGFLYLFYNDEVAENYDGRNPNEKICHICGKTKPYGKSMAGHLVSAHRPLATPLEKHIIQAHAYMLATDTKKTLFWYENKNNQEIIDIIDTRNEDLIQGIQRRANLLWEIAKQNKIPKKPYKAKNKSCFTCAYCKYNYLCWAENDTLFENSLEDIKKGKYFDNKNIEQSNVI
jgi:hypothetical protein